MTTVPVDEPAAALGHLGARLDRAVGTAIRRRRHRRAALASGVVAVYALVAPGLGGPSGLATDPGRADASRSPLTAPPTSIASGGSGAGSPPTAPPTRGSDAAVPPTPPPPGVAPDPASTLVLVDAGRRLPPGWVPPDLVVPDVGFVFTGPHEKRQLRHEAAAAFERLVAAAAGDGVTILGVSGYRSETTQSDLWGLAVARHGVDGARRSVARPGHSEHQTGLAIDVDDPESGCRIAACFAGTPTAVWLERRAHHFGFLVRYPAGAESVTGIQHEPWHLRFVGPVASTIVASGTTLDEHLGAA